MPAKSKAAKQQQEQEEERRLRWPFFLRDREQRELFEQYWPRNLSSKPPSLSSCFKLPVEEPGRPQRPEGLEPLSDYDKLEATLDNLLEAQARIAGAATKHIRPQIDFVRRQLKTLAQTKKQEAQQKKLAAGNVNPKVIKAGDK